MGRTVVTLTQQIAETESLLRGFRRTLHRNDQYILEGLFASARRHIAAISQAEALLPFETLLLAMLLDQAKEVAEEMGFEVLHMYVDSLFVQKKGLRTQKDFAPLLDPIQTGIPIALYGVYRWVVFLPSCMDMRIPVPNRYFGIFQDGSVKYRGIEARRHDSPPRVTETQLAVLDCLAQARTLDEVCWYLPEVQLLVQKARQNLKRGPVPLEYLVVTQKLSRALDAYITPSPAAWAAGPGNYALMRWTVLPWIREGIAHCWFGP